ncbi:hypothetical protein AC1031_015986 [Aphanomyces cochlioides]|nr:hypothetical protein AC1031_015986 [Aphanomyces cochlioides]
MAGNSAMKRKRNHSEDEKLNHTASVQLTREIKKIKTFETQKALKTLAKDPQNPTLKAKVDLLKALDPGHLARRAMLSLGLDPPEKKAKKETVSSDEVKALEASLLKHKRLAPLLDTWKVKATERANKLFQEENAVLKQSLEGKPIAPSTRRAASAPESMFVGSLSGGQAEVRYNFSILPLIAFQDDIADFLGENKKKNRPGQRARKQRALMEEQRKSGKLPAPTRDSNSKYGPSSRDKERPAAAQRPPRPGSLSNKMGKKKPMAAPAPRPAKATPAPPQRATITAQDKAHHPSWAAKQAQKEKEKIPAFAGKKVVFDD